MHLQVLENAYGILHNKAQHKHENILSH